MRKYTIPGFAWAALLLFGKWILDHALFDWFVHYLEDTWNIKEASLIASISSYVIPAVASAVVITIVYRVARHEWGSKTDNPLPDMKVSDAIDYIVNDSKVFLKQPRSPWIEEFGPGRRRRMIENGVEHTDARKQLNERLISGKVQMWGLRQMPVTHIANQFELSLREIKPEYWDGMQLDFLSCFHQTNTVPQTAQIPGKQADLQWTGLMVSREQVFREWPPKPRWRRLLQRIARKQRITYRVPLPDLSKLPHPTPIIEIIFDPENPARRFWSFESPRDEQGNKSVVYSGNIG